MYNGDGAAFNGSKWENMFSHTKWKCAWYIYNEVIRAGLGLSGGWGFIDYLKNIYTYLPSLNVVFFISMLV